MNIFANLLEAWRVARADRLFPSVHPTATLVASMADSPDPYFNEVPAVVHDKLCHAALEAALELVGQGEEGGNNRGPFVAMCVEPARVPQNWCGGFVGFCYQRASARMGIPLPFARSLGAKRLGENIARVGRKFTDPAEARPGDAMVFHRGAQGSWMGHIAMVERVAHDGTVHTVEGNCGPKVLRRMRFVDRDRFAFFASLRRQ